VVHRGERRQLVTGLRDIVITRHGALPPSGIVRGPEHFHRADRHIVVRGDDRVEGIVAANPDDVPDEIDGGGFPTKPPDTTVPSTSGSDFFRSATACEKDMLANRVGPGGRTVRR
jgi:hypothetical protein